MKKVLFLCVANSTRSQLAEGLARHLWEGKAKVMSAGSKPTQLNPLAVKVLAEEGIDISHHRAKSVREMNLDGVDLVITLCKEEICPSLPVQVEHLQWPIDDPAKIGTEDEAEALAAFRQARDSIAKHIKALEI
ncbi:arsenate reductase ArsC [Marinimicrobium alkaliphilum]|uniref:arsenate reductase ArsC n=1 Tax=Marinimicrobium alkaliphilum TaxID=2202654 RepID=UPI000DB96B99|nr:arsenate reductase ArsC [Marinimicrobium alkaliphilum]